MREMVHRIVASKWFGRAVLGVILFNAVLIGVDTYIDHPSLIVLEWLCVAVFVAELVLKFIDRKSTRAFFSDGWNIFDIIVVASAFVPAVGPLGSVLRVLRVFRVLRLVNAIPELRLIVSVLTRSIISMKYIGLLAMICFYVYAVIGVKLFGGEGSPLADEYRTIHEATFTLFRVLTGDNWSDLRYADITGGMGAAVTAYHVSWILIATFILINLIVGAIINNYQEVQQIEKHKHLSPEDADRRILELAGELNELVKARASRQK